MNVNTIKPKNNKSCLLKSSLIVLTAVPLLALSSSLFAATGKLVLVNSLAKVVTGNPGSSASDVKVVISDSTGVCSTTNTVAYNGVLTVNWDDSKTHSSSQCTGITSVAVSALKTSSGLVQYDSTANATPPAVATAATTFTAPTTAIANLLLVVTGSASPAMTGSATVWGSALGVAPIYATTNGLIATTGIMGAVGMAGIKAENAMRLRAIDPA